MRAERHHDLQPRRHVGRLLRDPGPPSTELCGTGIDEDCDGLTDEGFPDLGAPCTVGTGACAASGMRVCDAAKTGTVCSATPGMPAPEVCNNVDDDCDGVADDGNPGGGSACSTGLAGVCSAGTMTCTGGSLVCQQNVAPSAETCNGLDDNCSGTADEGFGLGAPCDGADGDLCNEGVIVCNGAGGTMCNDTSGANTEQCNGADDDCDGMVDEDFGVGAACDGADYDLCVEGTIVCNGPTATTCSDASGHNLESCNGWDDDCDGTVDEGCSGGACAGSPCVTGGPLATGCSPCVTTVCNADPYCCAFAWDGICVQEAQTMCGVCAVGTCAHPLCTTGDLLTSGCDVPPMSSSCVATVCADDLWCCSVNWDDLCVGEAQSWCGLSCP